MNSISSPANGSTIRVKPKNCILLLLLQLGHPSGIARSETSLHDRLILLFSSCSSTPTADQERCQRCSPTTRV
ncbi:hypothetical protein PBY51_021579 [Eleginops maclovinus]|uniref:Uncharacterized protein n=1 Tax=Eleginops maclovinus TaxID=56733 RepID=A0AAN8AM62_ELEMC|nr:hypothetical protein PBY51_021579 [Eleginops maclovinus]